MSYGSADGVAAFVPRYATPNGEFDQTTRPTAVQVTAWLTETSALIDAYIVTKGYSVPATDTTLVSLFDLFVNQEVAAMAEGVNGSGRFGPTNPNQRAESRFAILNRDMTDYLDSLLIGNQTIAGTVQPDRTDGFA
ncbi:MAG: hypothetical protein KDI12_22965 [Anaerolineae bacterium]|nr:hypothetical protein [Anaerolineae bacterium]